MGGFIIRGGGHRRGTQSLGHARQALPFSCYSPVQEIPFLRFIFNYEYVCVGVCASWDVRGKPLKELELLTVVRCPMWAISLQEHNVV